MVGPEGAPVIGAWVDAGQQSPDGIGRGAETDLNGEFEITGLPSDLYRVTINHLTAASLPGRRSVI